MIITIVHKLCVEIIIRAAKTYELGSGDGHDLRLVYVQNKM